MTTRRIVFSAYLTTVLAATLAPLSSGAYVAVSGFDKIVHIVLFGGVAMALHWNLNSIRHPNPWGVILITSIFAAFVELVQSMLPYRSGDVWDLIAGAVGAVLGVLSMKTIEAVFCRQAQES